MMVPLSELSKIGFGAYRIKQGNSEHADALRYALKQGCNLIDTASNYGLGSSELLIGEVIASHPAPVFIITKAGYLMPYELKEIEALRAKGLSDADITILGDDSSSYSIHPLVLDYKIHTSCLRLQRQWIDGFLLHNPEYLLKEKSEEEVYQQIFSAFEFLESEVANQRLRYYGISSNSLSVIERQKGFLSLQKILSRSKGFDHFKLIEFPFNIIENAPAIAHDDHPSVIELAKSKGLSVFSNRPFNANNNNEAVRLTVPKEYATIPVPQDGFDACFSLIREQLSKTQPDQNPMDIPVLRFLNENWMSFESEETAEEVLRNYFFPWVSHLFKDQSDSSIKKMLSEFYGVVLMAAKKNMALKSNQYRNLILEQGLIDKDDSKPFSQLLCENYLSGGIDHVLVGMRNKKYVDELLPLFKPVEESVESVKNKS